MEINQSENYKLQKTCRFTTANLIRFGLPTFTLLTRSYWATHKILAKSESSAMYPHSGLLEGQSLKEASKNIQVLMALTLANLNIRVIVYTDLRGECQLLNMFK